MGFSNMKIGTRIGVGFALVTLLLVISAIVSLMSAARLAASTEQITEDRYAKIVLANDMERRALDVARLMRTAVLVESPAEIDALIQKIQQDRAKNNEAMAQLDKTLNLPKGRELFNRITETRKALADKYESFFSLAKSDRHKATEYLFKDFAPANNGYMAVLEEMVAFQDQEMKKNAAEARQTYSSGRAMLIGLAIVAVLLAVFIGFTVTTSITGPVGRAVKAVQTIATGDLTQSLNVQGSDEIAVMLAGLRDMQAKLREVAASIAASAQHVSSAAGQLSSTTQQVSQSVNQQSEAVSSMSAAVEQMSVSISNVADNAADARNTSAESSAQSEQGSGVILQAVDEIGRIADFVSQSSNMIQVLQQQSTEISGIAGVIKDIADQTNLLALNAAIEAARAGEQGRGFAVVADEVRKLAERTTQSTHEISTMIASIQEGTSTAVKNMESGMELVTSGTTLANQAGDSINRIKASSSHVVEIVNDISSALSEQKIASESVASNIERIAQMVEENSVAAGQTAGAAHSLEALASDMSRTVAWFRT